jgi:hypothetical protein
MAPTAVGEPYQLADNQLLKVEHLGCFLCHHFVSINVMVVP